MADEGTPTGLLQSVSKPAGKYTVEYVEKLIKENDRLQKRVDELEAEKKLNKENELKKDLIVRVYLLYYTIFIAF